MTRNERVALWLIGAITGLVLIGLIALTVVVFDELNEVNENLLALTGGGTALEGSGGEGGGFTLSSTPAAIATIAPSMGGGQTQVAIAGVRVLTDSVTMTVTVRSHGAGDLLFEPPLLQSDENDVYQVTATSLEEARLEFLDLVTQGEATVGLEFAGRLAPTANLWLVFNSGQEPTSVTAPPLRAPVPLRTGGS